MSQKKTSLNFFGIRVDSLSADEVISRIESSQARPFWVVTANPEILLTAKRDASYAETLQHADVRTVDGFGLALLGRLFGARLKRTTGVDLVFKLSEWATKNGLPVALIGAEHPDAAKRSLAALQAHFPRLRGFSEVGGIVDRGGEGNIANDEARMRIALQDPAIIFVAFGHPKQERWIERCRDEFPNARAVIGVGGAFDYISGVLPRAPRWMRAIGFEWLYRLFTEPKRGRRIWDALVLFPISFIQDSFNNKQKREA
jgi:N-acetylglucosaminyldiphosphoundecaprenol N-acetyl-beta-D-mannosaminyltransferase